MQVETGSLVSYASGSSAAAPASILGMGVAFPPFHYSQDEIRDAVRERVFDANGCMTPERDETSARIDRLFAATGVKARQSVVDFERFYREPRSTGERMAEYARSAYPLALEAVEQCLARAQGCDTKNGLVTESITDLIVVSCTGYVAPGLDIQLARALGMPRDVRRVVIGHMGCFGALVGLRQALAALAAHPRARALLVCVELCSLHFAPTLDPEALTSFALFGDAAAAILLGTGADKSADDRLLQLLDTYCAADFESAEQMRWTITDAGFIMGLSPRVPITLRRNVCSVVDSLLVPHDLNSRAITHWIVHPGGPSILEVIAKKLELTDEQMAPSWQTLAEHGNCSSATVLLILERMLREGNTQRGELGVMMAFGPGLTLETALLRF